MKEIKDFERILDYLFDIGECPNFPDEMRNKANDLYCFINEHVELIKQFDKSKRMIDILPTSMRIILINSYCASCGEIFDYCNCNKE